ncbi:DUF302 domain-containing protein [Algihabitans albus]|uniref:DUF302 domain-containing protein n=1 Tax=Algihabitans albus TaxID=2164067 RepID=UPI000E5C5813|nr:DUF302 domain-containing protein [Algihabitans albus]
MRPFFTLLSLLILLSAPAAAAPDGLVDETTRYGYAEMIERLDQAVKDHKMGLVTRASATVGVKQVLEEDIPGNMVVGVYHPRFAKRMLEASVPAGIEAPIRFYITEEADGGTTLTYRTPSAVFAPWADGNDDLQALAAELDEIFAGIFAQATAD